MESHDETTEDNERAEFKERLLKTSAKKIGHRRALSHAKREVE